LCVKYSELLRLLKKDGWYKIRQKGSHIVMVHKTKPNTITVPYHGAKEVKKGMCKAILKQAGISTNKR